MKIQSPLVPRESGLLGFKLSCGQITWQDGQCKTLVLWLIILDGTKLWFPLSSNKLKYGLLNSSLCKLMDIHFKCVPEYKYLYALKKSVAKVNCI